MKKRILLKKLKKDVKVLKTVEVLFIMDLTGSMGPYLEQCKKTILKINDRLKNTLPECEFCWGFLGYRDFEDEEKFVIQNFSRNTDDFKKKIELITVQGGGDECEDVTGAFEYALQFEWTGQCRVIFFIADAPNHGQKYHENSNDNYLNQEIKSDKSLESFIEKVKSKKIFLYLLDINDSTKKMFDIICKTYNSYNELSHFSEFKVKVLNYREINDNIFEQLIAENLKKSYFISRSNFYSQARSFNQNSVHEGKSKKAILTAAYLVV